MSIIQIRDLNTGKLLRSQQISDDAGIYQKECLAEKLADSTECHDEFIYAVEVVNGVAKNKWSVYGGIL
ncbi:MAG: hypothetical protein GOVbin1096_123 [Prokaryotic dsDNA virus sp.]|jgi:hypothetical protein|nr:MAG: hypothetical protein GOVbin1096_123 [Prokaryotic dsDNA virus sp.]|tara:strand:- start:30829 stop:31035 length:207 start_codon:yes stop_codon:yes gene_type:complete